MWLTIGGFVAIAAVLAWLFWPWDIQGRRRPEIDDSDAPDEFWL